VKDIKPVSAARVKATFDIAADAPFGRRYVRVVGGSNGITGARYFFVGSLPEIVEKEGNNTPLTAQDVAMPVVINARIDKALDVDCFLFAAKKGERLVIALCAHGMDSTQRIGAFNLGYLDAGLELLDDSGKVLAAADDTLGLDPVLEHTFKDDGKFTVRVQSLGFKGSATSVYRLTIGDVPYPTHVFPPGGQRGKEITLEVGGLNMKPGTHKLTPAADGSYPLHFLPPLKAPTDGRDLPLLRTGLPTRTEAEPNSEPAQATPIPWPSAIHGRFDKPGDEDWHRLTLKKGQGVVLEVIAQRLLGSPVDTHLEICDASGKKLAENDDGLPFINQCAHDFASADSWLAFTAPADGDYLVRIRDQSGAGGPRAVYQLVISELRPDFHLYQWPDAVPVWGPGTSATFVVECYHWGGLKGDLHLRIEDLPPGWTGSTVNWSGSSFAHYPVPNGMKAILTITAPADAKIGTVVPFRVIGKLVQDGKTIEKEAQYQTLYGNAHNDRMFLRSSPKAYAAVAGYMDAWPATEIKELTAAPGEAIKIPVKIQRKPGGKRGDIGVVVNCPTVAAGCALGPPQPVKADQDEHVLVLTLSPATRPGTIGVVVARSWSSDLRAGRPGPCTPLILLHVVGKKK
jgi:hypothetical protein